jgi:DNA-binding SARP family transcriptional activator
MGALQGHFLGGFRLNVGNVAIEGLTTQKSRSVLAYLMLNPDRRFGRETLVETIWGEGRRGDTMKALRQELWIIRRAFRENNIEPKPYFALDREDLGAVGSPWVDVAAFETAIETPAAEFNRPLDDAAAARLKAAVAHYTGDLLPGLYDDWCLFPREILRDKFIIAVERLMEWYAAHAEWGAAILQGKRLLDADPLLEHVHRGVMRYHYARGDRPAALRQYAACKRHLRKELTIEPMVETTTLYEAIRQEAEVDVILDAAAHYKSIDRQGLRSRPRYPSALSALGAIRNDLDAAGRRIEAIMRQVGGK